jgi:hypothetical protein
LICRALTSFTPSHEEAPVTIAALPVNQIGPSFYLPFDYHFRYLVKILIIKTSKLNFHLNFIKLRFENWSLIFPTKNEGESYIEIKQNEISNNRHK